MAKVFISYVHEDEAVANAVQQILVADLKLQFQIFIVSDRRQVVAGADWLQQIKDNLKDSEVVILMMSRRSVHRPWVNFEAGSGWILGKTLIPVCYGNMRNGQLPKPYSDFQGVNLPEDEQYLIDSVARHLGLPRPARPVAGASQTMRFPSARTRPDLVTILTSFKDES